MAVILSPIDYLHFLRCSCSPDSSLTCAGNVVRCNRCNTEFKVSHDSVLEFVDARALDNETARELQGNTYQLTRKQIQLAVLAERANLWKSYYSRNRRPSIVCLAKHLKNLEFNTLFFLGAGRGREIEYLSWFVQLDTVFCSDLSYSALQMIPLRLAAFDLKVGLFTSDLNHCPIKAKGMPIVIVNALHHTQDMHAALERLLNAGYEHILLSEPTNNFVIRRLAKLGLAQRVEYSGVRPGRLEISKVRALCRRYGYRVTVTTMWDFPEDYYRKLFGKSELLQPVFFVLLRVISQLTNVAKCGNHSTLSLEKVS